MDFRKFTKNLKENISPFIKKAEEIGKAYSEKAIDFTTKQASTTPLFINSEEEYNIHASTKRAIFIAYDEDDKETKDLILLFPIWGSKAWIDNAELRYLAIRDQKELARTLMIQGPLEMRISYNGNLFLKSNNLKEIKEWWNNRCYREEKNETSAAKDESKDPLSEA